MYDFFKDFYNFLNKYNYLKASELEYEFKKHGIDKENLNCLHGVFRDFITSNAMGGVPFGAFGIKDEKEEILRDYKEKVKYYKEIFQSLLNENIDEKTKEVIEIILRVI